MVNPLKIVDLKQVYVGENVVWTIRVTNNGPSAARNVKVADQLPDALKVLTAKVTKGKFNKKTCEWTINVLGSGESAILILSTKVVREGIITNPVSVKTTTEESNYTNNKANDTTKAIAVADLELIKDSDKKVYLKGDKMHWIITVINHGPCTARDVVVSDLLPAGVKFTGFKVSKGSYDVSTGIWDIGDLAKGETVSIEIYCIAKVDGIITNHAKVTSSVKDTNLTNNHDSATIKVVSRNHTEPVHPSHPVTMKNTGNPLTYLIIAICILFGSFWSRNRKE